MQILPRFWSKTEMIAKFEVFQCEFASLTSISMLPLMLIYSYLHGWEPESTEGLQKIIDKGLKDWASYFIFLLPMFYKKKLFIDNVLKWFLFNMYDMKMTHI